MISSWSARKAPWRQYFCSMESGVSI